ncbi:FkbM family methyltransferase [Roseovarius salinarum]|uniref:FkbM family methyltransferase n=1 Tax=Roseovarius salinarum TaxID=1981892 RepID=UPI0012FFF75D|nr:FkbM family methyltransferase [Roseovarius salinarum]
MFKRLATYLRGRRRGLRSPPGREALYPITVGGTEREVLHSRFNTAWPGELGIDPGVIVDLGAYDGGDAYRFAKAFPNARVISAEADPERHEIVRKTLSETRVELFNVAVCDRDGPVEWYPATVEGERHAQGSIYRHSAAYKERFPNVEQTETPTTVAGMRFSTLCERAGIDAIDLLHMDIEGAEYTVLDTLDGRRPKLIYLECRDSFFVGNRGGRAIETLLDELGYDAILQLSADRLYHHRTG